ncbi:hypothetical protein CALCODRAFT_489489 [Calocera cornea HHB12733]|uniref:Small ribosomal subunit protein bS18m n=1 Tax=Calocera cornea HHB12733 TaxID=1353952 RepID=A0A165KC71_9BASI|nr:hypothetical protein CALCODRAFT_489489 [Calocera cornea HHB12733]
MLRAALPRRPLMARSVLAGPSSARQLRTTPARDTADDSSGIDQAMDNLVTFVGSQAENSAEELNTKALRQFIPDHSYTPWELSRGSREYQGRNHRRTPFRLGPARKVAEITDPFYSLGIDPLREWHNVELLSDYMTETGTIKPRKDTRLTWRSQRKMGQAIRRAKAVGILPTWSRDRVVEALLTMPAPSKVTQTLNKS